MRPWTRRESSYRIYYAFRQWQSNEDVDKTEKDKIMSMTNKKGLLLGFLIGSVFGGTIALFYAPKKGKHLRHDIGRKTGEIMDSGRKMAVDTWNGVKDTAENTLDSANNMLNSGMEKIARKTENIRDAFTAGMSTYSDEKRAGKKEAGPKGRDVEISGRTY